MTTNKIEIIIPTHNELETVDELIERIDTVRTNNDLSLCLTFVDDSNDGTHSLIEEKIKEYKYIKLIRLVRQFSQASAIFAGLQESEADAVIIMDADRLAHSVLPIVPVNNNYDRDIVRISHVLYNNGPRS